MSEKNISKAILESLTNNLEFTRKVLPFLKDEYFETEEEKTIFKIQSTFFDKFDCLPSKDIIEIELNSSNLYEKLHEDCQYLLEEFTDEHHNTEWLIEASEKYCQERALYNAMSHSLEIMGGENKKIPKSAIPGLLEEALAVGFNNKLGHDYLEDAIDRWEHYVNPDNKIPFDIDMLNKITKGGYSLKTLNIIAAGTNVGKTIFGCHYAARALKMGKNVLYISMEMASEDIGNRIDANLMAIEVDQVRLLQKENFLKRVDAIKGKTNGKLIIEQFPTGEAHAGHFMAFINELKIKKGFKPDIIIIDYLNICASKAFPRGHDNSNTLISAVSKELRAMMIKLNCIGLTFTQFNRDGMKSSDNELTDTADAIGATFNADSYFAMNEPEELAALNQIMFKQLKNRYSDKNIDRRFLVGLEKARMTFYNVENGVEKMPDIGSSVRSKEFKPNEGERKDTKLTDLKSKRGSLFKFN